MTQSHDTPAAARLAEAAAWCVRLTEAGCESSPRFEAWLGDPANAAAWQQVSYSWDYLGEMSHTPELLSARQAALGHAKRAHANRSAPRHWRRTVGAIAAVLVMSVAVWGGLLWLQRPDDYRTAMGERRIITLEDGSKVSLDSSSEVTIRYSKNARELHLLHGQARFDVAHDVERPFSVLAGNQKVIATGTAFNIDMAGPKVLVTLIEGHVVVLDESPDDGVAERKLWRPASVELKAGQQLAKLPAVPPEVGFANISRVTAWTNGQIMFDNEPLTSVVARLNRYSATQIVVDDPKVAALRISGVLNAGDVNGFVDIVTQYLPVKAVSTDSGDILLEGQPKG